MRRLPIHLALMALCMARTNVLDAAEAAEQSIFRQRPPNKGIDRNAAVGTHRARLSLLIMGVRSA